MNNAIYNGMKQAPCRDCEKRTVGCHAGCEQYQEFRRYREAVKAEQYRQRETAEYFISSARKQAQRKRRKTQ